MGGCGEKGCCQGYGQDGSEGGVLALPVSHGKRL
jgi:hypothetical protein